MRRRPLFWLFVSVLCFLAAFYFWRLGDKWAAEKAAASPVQPTEPPAPAKTNAQPGDRSLAKAPELLTDAGTLNRYGVEPVTNAPRSRLAYRLSNTTDSVGQLTRNPSAILLENALVDSSRPLDLAIPAHLRAQGDPGTYIVQSRSSLDARFRELLKNNGAQVVSYIPNNAYLVRADAATAQRLGADAQTQTVLPYEPYYKLKPALLSLAVQQLPLPEGSTLNVLLFADSRKEVLSSVRKLGVETLSEERSPFGPVLKVHAPAYSLSALAGLPGVQEIELAQNRVPANDLSRASTGVAANSTTNVNYLGLTGANILVNVNDTGVDASHPDLKDRVFWDFPPSDVDTNGHGTHVAGIIASSGDSSLTVTNASGSTMPPVDKQFRGKAPAARIFSMQFNEPDSYLQETAARTNALISNNSWHYHGAEYDLAAASYDAAVRDSLPFVTGSQPLIYVFGAGNSGGGDDNGTTGSADSILSPATAKNVITVGAVEQLRNITNQVVKCVTFQGERFCSTNKPWELQTDSAEQVAAYSSRGNVGIGVEGDAGRFKPDLVAPGSFVVSTRSTMWDDATYYNSSNTVSAAYRNLVVDPGSLWLNTLFIPDNAVAVTISVVPNEFSPVPFPDMPIYIRQADAPTNAPGGYDFLGTNQVNIPPDLPLNPVAVDWWYGIGNPTNHAISFDVVTSIVVTNDQGDYFDVLRAMNDGLGPYYRYESGTSMAGAGVSGTLALMEEFFTQRAHRTNSPALMKALLINGARSVGNLYDLNVNSTINFQGWGLLNLPNSLPGALSNLNTSASSSMYVFDQNPTNALATGQRHTVRVRVSAEAKTQPLRVTLAWTDPPGNPIASVKLVNDLDLVVTNLDNGDVYYGNDITTGNDFNLPWYTNSVPNIDVINNVENVLIVPDLGTNYSITVRGSHVNVNAVTEHPDNVAQDYALVISGGEGVVPNALTLTDEPIVAVNQPFVTIMTNSFQNSSEMSGTVLLGQHAGANTPLLGTNTLPLENMANALLTLGVTNQWHFYVISNQFSFTNAAFMTFLPPDLAVPRMGVNETDPNNASRTEADIDLYVSHDPGLTNLDPAVIASAYKSLGRGGSETIILSNAEPGLYFLGVKSEDHMAAEYGILGVFSLLPFASSDAEGNQTLRGFPFPSPIPDAHLDVTGKIVPGLARMFAFGPGPQLVRRVIATNVVSHELMGDLMGTLMHDRRSAILNNHTTNELVLNQTFIYDDSGENDVPGAQRSDGPGTLHEFAGRPGVGQWFFTQADGAVGHLGTNGLLTLFLERQPDLTEGIVATIQPGACREDFVEVPAEATNLTVEVTVLSGSGPVSMQVCPLESTGADCKSTTITNVEGASITIDIFDDPPLRAGVYSVRLCNQGTGPITVRILARILINPFGIAASVSGTSGAVPLVDDAVTYAYITNLTHLRISSLDIGLLLNHPRISDLAITLISPDGTRLVLFDDRGGTTANGLGNVSTGTNGVNDVLGYTNMTAFWASDFDRSATGPYSPGATFEGWNVLSNQVAVASDLTIPWLGNNVLVLGDGGVSNNIPTTNATTYSLSFRANHAPWLVGMIGWWPFDEDARDIFGAHDGILYGDPTFSFTTGMVSRAFFGDGVRSRVVVPVCRDIDVGPGRGFTVEGWIFPTNAGMANPIVEWNDPTNVAPQGVQFWLSGLSYTNVQVGALVASLWDTNLQPHLLQTPLGAITNGGWQHVALSYDATTHVARVYTNGQLAIAETFATAVPRTPGNLYFGFHPDDNANVAAFSGGLDEMSLYGRALSDCEVAAIYNAGIGGKYGTNVLSCPVTWQLTLAPDGAPVTYVYTNGLAWTNGPVWETNSIVFTTTGTNPTPLVVNPLDPNVAVDDFVLSRLITNTLNGALKFTENTNLALVPIKFAPTPYVVSNFPPFLVFSNDFEYATQGVYQAGSVVPALDRGWLVTTGAVAVISNNIVDADGTNALALSRGAVQLQMPTQPGHRYRLDYTVRGPGAVGWWNGSLDPLSRRAVDLIGAHNGAFIDGAINSTVSAEVGPTALFLPGVIDPVNDLSSKIELGDPPSLHLTNALTIEAWIRPITPTNASASAIEQIFFRGDSRICRDPYYLALERNGQGKYDLLFHVEDADQNNCGVMLKTADQPVNVGEWQHVAAVFESNVHWSDPMPWPTNELRLYLNGVLLTNVFLQDPSGFGSILTSFTGQHPSWDLEPSFSPGIAIGNRSRADNSQPFSGYIDELTVYGRALTEPEIAAIMAAGPNGKADTALPPSLSLAKVQVSVDNILLDTAYGDNAGYTARAVSFVANRTNALLNLQGMLPGTIIDHVSLTELPAEMNYLPEQPMDALVGMDAYGVWALEIWDTRAGATNDRPRLVQWQLDFKLVPSNAPPTIYLEHGIPYANTLGAYGTQNFVVDVPQWALFATNVLEFATNRNTGALAPLGVLFDLTNRAPSSVAGALFWPPVDSGIVVLTTNTAAAPYVVPGEPYFLTVTNTTAGPVNYSLGVWFDIMTLTNCQPATNYVGPAGIPRYLQFDVPTNDVSPDFVKQAVFWLTGAQSNLTVVFSQTLPLPDLTHYDYISQQPCTNDEVVMVVTNTTPFPLQTNRWYVGVFNNTATNVPFTAQACYALPGPDIIPLTNGVPFVGALTSRYFAPPGPPRSFFFEFDITNATPAVLFELYGLSGDADLVLQKEELPGMAPYFAGSYQPGLTPEQIVVRTGNDLADLRGHWYLGVYNNETNDVAYTIRAITPATNGLLESVLPPTLQIIPPAGPHGLVLQWNSVVGEPYVIEMTRLLVPMDWQLVLPFPVFATTPLSAIELPVSTNSSAFYRVRQISRSEVLMAPLTIQLLANNTIRIAWPTTFAGWTLQYSIGLNGPWLNVNLPVVLEGNEYAVYDTIGAVPKFYRLVP